MTKNIFKEIGIGLLILVAITLILWIILCDYDPKSIMVPAKVQAYELPSEVKDEIDENVSLDSQNIIKTYYVDSSSLSIYENNDSYDKGKADPFTSYKGSTNSENNTQNNSNNTNTNNTNTSNNSNTTGSGGADSSSDSTGTFFNGNGKG